MKKLLPPMGNAELAAQGIGCSRERVARLMQEMELVAKHRRKTPVGTVRRKGVPGAPNLLNREFSAAHQPEVGQRYDVCVDG